MTTNPNEVFGDEPDEVYSARSVGLPGGRGIVDHMPDDPEMYDIEESGYAGSVGFLPPEKKAPDIDPVPVVIVSTPGSGTREVKKWDTRKESFNSVNPKILVNRRARRTNVQIINVDTGNDATRATLYVAPDDRPKFLMSDLAPGDSIDINSEWEVFAAVDSGEIATVIIYETFTVEV